MGFNRAENGWMRFSLKEQFMNCCPNKRRSTFTHKSIVKYKFVHLLQKLRLHVLNTEAHYIALSTLLADALENLSGGDII